MSATKDTGSLSMKQAKTIIPVMIRLGCLVVLLYFAGDSIYNHHQHDTRALIKLRNSSNEPYIAFTVCPLFQEFKTDVLASYNLNLKQYTYHGKFVGNSSDKNGWDIFQQVTYDLEELLSSFYVQTKSSEHHWIFLICKTCHTVSQSQGIMRGSGKTRNINKTWNENEIKDLYTLKEKYSKNYGRCFEFQFKERITKFGLTEATFVSQGGKEFFVFFHAQGQFHSMEKSRIYSQMDVKVFAGLSTAVQVDTLEQESKMPCSKEMNHKLDDCIYKEAAEKMMLNFNCVLPFFPKNLTQPICRGHSKWFHQKNNFYEQAISNEHWGLCKNPCKKMTASIEIYEKDAKAPKSQHNAYNNKSYIKVYLRSTVQVTEIILDYPFTQLIADIGGFVGLLLGYSVADVNSILQWIFYWMMRKIK